MKIMKKGMLRMELCRLVHTIRFWLAPVGLAAACVGAASLDVSGQNVINTFGMVFDLNQFDLIFVLFAAIPFSGAFFDEWKNNFSINVIGRGAKENYLGALYVTACLSAFVTVMAGLLLFSFVMSLVMPVHDVDVNEGYSMAEPYGVFLQNGHPWLYLICRIYLCAMGAMLCVGIGVMASAIFPDAFAAIAFPFIGKYVLGWMTMNFPAALNINQIMWGKQLLNGGAAIHAAYVFVFIISCLIIFFMVFRYFAVKRLNNEID